MRATPAYQQLGGKRTTASGGADSEARRASRLDAGDHGRHRDHETDPVWSTGRERAFGVAGSIRGYRQASLAAGETRGANRLARHPKALGLPSDYRGTAFALTSLCIPKQCPRAGVDGENLRHKAAVVQNRQRGTTDAAGAVPDARNNRLNAARTAKKIGERPLPRRRRRL